MHIIKRYIPAKLFNALQPVYHYCLAALAAAWYGWPSNKLIVVGITGTTGKTSSLYLAAKTLEAAGFKAGFTSTAIFSDGDQEWLNDKKMTMPGRFFTQKILRQMVKNNCRYAIIETTSQGIEQFRHRFINYDVLIFTGLYPEHIEAHGGFVNYRRAKGKLFAHLKKCKTKYADDKKRVVKAESGLKKIGANRVKKIIVANADDRQAGYFLDFWAESKYAYAKVREQATELTDDKIQLVEYGEVKSDKAGVSFRAGGTEIKMNLLGEYNAANAMNAYCLGLSQGLRPQKIKAGLEKIKGIPGRMEIIKNAAPDFTVVVDYAFEPEALNRAYDIIKKLEHNRIIHVLGSCGGWRDAARRPILGRIAGENADLVIVANEDPYDDDPKLIIDQVTAGAESAGKILTKDLFKIEDRELAIEQALFLAKAKDIILISGKGCEQAICGPAGSKIKWDDRVVVREKLKHLERPVDNL